MGSSSSAKVPAILHIPFLSVYTYACSPPAPHQEGETKMVEVKHVPPSVVRKVPVMPQGELNVLAELFSSGITEGTPSIRKACLDFGLGLDAAHQLEMANIVSPQKLTESTIRTFQSKLKVRGRRGGRFAIRWAN